MKKCPFCAEDIQDEAIVCKHCGRELSEFDRHGQRHSHRARTVGLIGSGIMAIGTFLPVASVPMLGSINYFRSGSGDGVIIVALAAIGALAALIRPKWLITPGVTALGFLTVTMLALRTVLEETKAATARQLEDNPFRGIAEAMSQSAELEWGWAVMFSGALTVVVASFLDQRPALPAWIVSALLLIPIGMYAYVVL